MLLFEIFQFLLVVYHQYEHSSWHSIGLFDIEVRIVECTLVVLTAYHCYQFICYVIGG